VFARLFDVLFPTRCVGCGRIGATFCDACRPRPEAARRVYGAHGLAVDAAGRYAGVLRSAILLYKRGRRDAGDALSTLLADRVAASLPEDCILVPVPTTRSRRGDRGFDQSVRLARGLGARTGAPVLVALAQVAGDAQRGRTRARRVAARGRFACIAPNVIAEARVVLVDDVMTTGATLEDCVRTLERHGGVVAGAVVLAYA
jgi:predicted amidophosphoribosyltransferase